MQYAMVNEFLLAKYGLAVFYCVIHPIFLISCY